MRFISVFFVFIFFSVSCFSIPPSPPFIGFLINNGEKFTNQPEIQVKLRSLKTSPELIESMQIGTKSDLSDAEWRPFSSEPVLFTLSAGDGEKFIYARLKDKAGNITNIESASIILDTTPPGEMEVAINKDSQFTNDKTGKVFLQVKGNDAIAWQISSSSNFAGSRWEALSNNKQWTLDLRGGDGEKFIYVQFKDEAGNISEVITKSIILDTEPPKNGQIIINNGDKYTKSAKVNLKVKANGAHLIRIADKGAGENYEYKPGDDGFMTIPWKFDSLQGKKFVRAFFMDAATNKTTAPVEAEIIFDTQGPAAPKLVIDNGNKFTNSKDGKVDLQIFLKENEPNLRLALSNDQTFNNATSQPFSSTVQGFTVPSQEDGLKNIYVKITDEAGNDSEISSSSIILDRTAPVIKKFSVNGEEEFVINPRVSIQIEAEDAVAMQISNNPNFTGVTKWEQYRPVINDWKIIPGDGKKTVYARFKDAAGNPSQIFQASVTLDTQPPVGKFAINGGEKFTNDPKVKISVEHEGGDVAGMQISNTPDFSNAKLIPVSNEVTGWQLGDTDGTRTVFLRLKDKAGNYSTVYASNIILDRQPPENCEIKINNGEEWTTNPAKKVALSLTSVSAYKMKVSNSADMSNAVWMPYRTSISWTLEGEEGTHTVYAIFADQSDNISAPVSASIKSDFTPPVVKEFTVEGNKRFCNDPQKRISITIDIEGASEMAIDNIPVTENTAWEPVKSRKDWILSNEDGLKTIYARFRDPAGNVTEEQTIRIMLDRVPPIENEIYINKNDEWLTNKEGKAALYIKSNGASEIMLSNSANFSNATWEAFDAIREGWPVDVSLREARVYCKFRDEAGNISEAVSDNIKIDVIPPANPRIVINKGDKFLTNSERKMTIGISVEGAKFMRVSTEKSFRDTDWEPIGGIKEIVVLDGDGVKSVYAQFKDQAENMSEVVSDDIILDTTPPKLISFQIDNGSEWTNSNDKKVVLAINAEDASEMRIDHDPAFTNTNWQKYSSSRDFVLPGEDGEKTLFLILKDEAGNISTTYSAKINLKRNF